MNESMSPPPPPQWTSPSESAPPQRGRPSGFLALRIVMISVGALLGIVLLTTGHVVIGVILLVMASLRVAMVVRMQRWRRARRAQFEQRRAQRFSQRLP